MVVFPLLPVIPIVLALVNGKANSISEITGMFNATNFFTIGAFSGIPGLFITISASKSNDSVCFSSSQAIPLIVRTSL